MQWMAGGTSLLQALGVDTVFYNSSINVEQVGIGGIGPGTYITGWDLNFGGQTAGGGFGDFLSQKNHEPGGINGISDPLYFYLNTDSSDFWAGGESLLEFAAHVRYENGCSGWVSNRETSESQTGKCGVSVPEPSGIALLGIGLLGLGFAYRRRNS